jgi:hypothetical protein
MDLWSFLITPNASSLPRIFEKPVDLLFEESLSAELKEK